MFHNLNFPGALLLLCCTLWGWRALLSLFFVFAELYQHFALYSQMLCFAATDFLLGD